MKWKAMARSTYLRIYLQDMEAFTRAACRLAGRALGSNRGTPYQPATERAYAVLRAEHEAQRALMGAVGIAPNAIKDAAAVAAEALGRLKLNGKWLSYSPLSRVLELQGLLAAIHARIAFWRAMAHLAESDRRFDAQLAEQRLDELAGIVAELDDVHRRAAAEALAV